MVGNQITNGNNPRLLHVIEHEKEIAAGFGLDETVLLLAHNLTNYALVGEFLVKRVNLIQVFRTQKRAKAFKLRSGVTGGHEGGGGRRAHDMEVKVEWSCGCKK
jgi:hypothetical protein